MSVTNGISLNEEYRNGSNQLFNRTLLAFLNAGSEFDIIAIWRIIYYLENYFESECGQPQGLTEDMITNAFHTLREEGRVEGYLRPSPLHKATGCSLAIVLEEVTPKGVVPDDNKAFIYFQSVVNATGELTRGPLKKTASNFELLKVLLDELIEAEISETMRNKAQGLKDELNSPS